MKEEAGKTCSQEKKEKFFGQQAHLNPIPVKSRKTPTRGEKKWVGGFAGHGSNWPGKGGTVLNQEGENGGKKVQQKRRVKIKVEKTGYVCRSPPPREKTKKKVRGKRGAG